MMARWWVGNTLVSKVMNGVWVMGGRLGKFCPKRKILLT